MRGLAAAAILALTAAACAPPGPEGVDQQRLADAVGRAIGDPNTCVLMASKADGEIVWRYGTHMTCARELPSCQGAGRITVEAVKDAAVRGEEIAISCPSLRDGSTSVGWAAGPIQASPGTQYGELVFAAVMEGERALPGREITLRLEQAFKRAGM